MEDGCASECTACERQPDACLEFLLSTESASRLRPSELNHACKRVATHVTNERVDGDGFLAHEWGWCSHWLGRGMECEKDHQEEQGKAWWNQSDSDGVRPRRLVDPVDPLLISSPFLQACVLRSSGSVHLTSRWLHTHTTTTTQTTKRHEGATATRHAAVPDLKEASIQGSKQCHEPRSEQAMATETHRRVVCSRHLCSVGSIRTR